MATRYCMVLIVVFTTLGLYVGTSLHGAMSHYTQTQAARMALSGVSP